MWGRGRGLRPQSLSTCNGLCSGYSGEISSKVDLNSAEGQVVSIQWWIWGGKKKTLTRLFIRAFLRICLQCRRQEFDPWVGTISWRKKWQHTPVFLPGESHGQKTLAGYGPCGGKELDTTERLTHTVLVILDQVCQNTYAFTLWPELANRSTEWPTPLHSGPAPIMVHVDPWFLWWQLLQPLPIQSWKPESRSFILRPITRQLFPKCCCLVTKVCSILCDPIDCSLPVSSQSVRLPRQEYWSGLPFPSPGDLPNPGIEPTSLALEDRFFTAEPPGKSLR